MTVNKTTPLILCVFIISLGSFGQNKILSNLRFDANLNYLNKKRSYAVYSDDKYVNSGYFLGLDIGLYYETAKLDFGIEYYPYNHINGTIVYSGLKLTKNEATKFKIKPNLKLGYSPVLEKVYYGGGINISYAWIHVSYNKILHLKSGESKYHGDGMDIFSVGISIKKEMFTSKKKNHPNG